VSALSVGVLGPTVVERGLGLREPDMAAAAWDIPYVERWFRGLRDQHGF
jgi:hypothetical protein